MWGYIAAIVGGAIAALLAVLGLRRHGEERSLADRAAVLAREHAARERADAVADAEAVRAAEAELMAARHRRALDDVDRAVHRGLGDYLRGRIRQGRGPGSDAEP